MVMYRIPRAVRSASMVLIGMAMVLVPVRSHAVIGTIDHVPAATLLLPYFEVDLNDSNAQTTLFTVTNTGPAAIIAHVVLWTDYAFPTITFDMQLTGYDVHSINLRQIFNGDEVPVGGGTVDFSTAVNVDKIVEKHTGQIVDIGMGTLKRFAFYHGDNVARGYITIDVVGETTALVPGNNGYFVTGGTGIALNNNVLWGEYMMINTQHNFAHGDPMVHIEASSSDARVTTSGNYTFYGTKVNGTAADNREPLASSWSVPFGGVVDDTASTDVIYWRDPKSNESPPNPFAFPSWVPLEYKQLIVFDDSENPNSVPDASIGRFSFACGRVEVGGGDLPGTPELGWLFLDSSLNSSGVLFSDKSQSFLAVITSTQGRFNIGHEGTPLSSAIQAK